MTFSYTKAYKVTIYIYIYNTVIEKRLSSLSSSKEIFEETAPYYEQQLSNCGYKEKLNYRDPTPQNLITKRKRQRNILWFNPPYSKTVKTKIGKFFLQLIKKHFPKEHKFHKIFNRNTLKLSYSCMPNIKTKINAHNREILRNTPSKNTKHCNCQQKENCPMNGACLKKSLVYYATISCNDKNYQPKLYKEVAKQVLRSAIVTIKNHLMYHCTNMIPSYQQSIGT